MTSADVGLPALRSSRSTNWSKLNTVGRSSVERTGLSQNSCDIGKLMKQSTNCDAVFPPKKITTGGRIIRGGDTKKKAV